jgi:hypothetical protein
VLSAGQIFDLHALKLKPFPLSFFIHKLPSLEVSIVLLNSIFIRMILYLVPFLFYELLPRSVLLFPLHLIMCCIISCVSLLIFNRELNGKINYRSCSEQIWDLDCES